MLILILGAVFAVWLIIAIIDIWKESSGWGIASLLTALGLLTICIIIALSHK